MSQFVVAKPAVSVTVSKERQTPEQAALAVGEAQLVDYSPEKGGIELGAGVNIYYSQYAANTVYQMMYKNPQGKFAADGTGKNLLGTLVVDAKNFNNRGVAIECVSVMSALVRRSFRCLPGVVQSEKVIALNIQNAESRGVALDLGANPKFSIGEDFWSFVFAGNDYAVDRAKAELIAYQKSQTPVWAIFSVIGSILRYEELAKGARAIFYGVMDQIGEGKSLLVKGLDLAFNARALNKGAGPTEEQLPYVHNGMFYTYMPYVTKVLDTLAADTREQMNQNYYNALAAKKLAQATDAAAKRAVETQGPEITEEQVSKLGGLLLPLNAQWVAEQGDLWVKALTAAGVLQNGMVAVGKIGGAITLKRYSKKSNNPITGSIKIDAVNGISPEDAQWLLGWNANVIDFGVTSFTPGQ